MRSRRGLADLASLVDDAQFDRCIAPPEKLSRLTKFSDAQRFLDIGHCRNGKKIKENP